MSERAKTIFWTPEMDVELRRLHGSMSVAQLAERLGRTKGSVRGRITALGIAKKSEWTEEQEKELRSIYLAAGTGGVLKLAPLIAATGRDKGNISRKAKELGLPTSMNRKRVDERKEKVRKYADRAALSVAISARMKKTIAEKGHPRGMLGLKHSPEALEKIAKASVISNAARTDEMKVAYNLKAAKTKMRNGTYAPERHKTTWKGGWREIGGIRKFYRSRWEANYASYLEWLKTGGHIADWKHEPKTFWFEGVKRGTVSYLPDFWVVENDGTDAFHEVKGWMDDRSKTKIKRMEKYYPEVKLVVIDSKGYAALKKSVSSLVPGWEA